jgi:hypothetical protein
VLKRTGPETRSLAGPTKHPVPVLAPRIVARAAVIGGVGSVAAINANAAAAADRPATLLAATDQPLGTQVALAIGVGAVMGFVCASFANLLSPSIEADPQTWSFYGSMLLGWFALCVEMLE